MTEPYDHSHAKEDARNEWQEQAPVRTLNVVGQVMADLGMDDATIAAVLDGSARALGLPDDD